MPNITQSQNKWLVYLILSVCLIVPFSNDEYIPALPEIAIKLATQNVQWIMSIFLLGLSVAQLFYGPLLDRYGRKPVLIVGLVIFIIGSFFTVIANSIEMLLIARLIQAIGACCGIVSVLAIVRDAYPPEDIIKMTAFIMAIIAICPTVAPIIGSLLQIIGGWRACFAFLLIMGLFYLIIISIYLQETHRDKNLNALKFKHLFINYFNLLRNKQYLGFILVSCFSYASLFSFFAVAPFLLINLLHLPLSIVGIIIAINAIPLLSIAYIIPKLTHKIDLFGWATIGALFILAGGLFMVTINLMAKPSLLGLIVPMFISAIGIGIIRPTASSGAIKLVDKKIAGSASALFSFASFLGSALCTSLTTRFNNNSILPFAILLSILGFCAFLSIVQTLTKPITLNFTHTEF